ncbi:hypothetical protein Q1695_010202 [Nippostrongylus brasiliensis]|nr:hypothetical protein Q1695_010202 [Nippostrongylus brasiliensis]
MAAAGKEGDGKRRFVIYQKETYDRKIAVSRTTPNPEEPKEPLLTLDRPPIVPRIENPQVHTSGQNVENKVVDGQHVRTETFVEHMEREDKKEGLEPVAQAK